MQIENCFDSHVHWLGTGQAASELNLSTLKSPEDVRALKVESSHWRGEWLTGFGWNLDPSLPQREVLDALSPDRPVAFTRADGHAVWVNTEALKRSGLWQAHPHEPQGGRILLDAKGWPKGVLLDTAKNLIEQKMPPFTGAQARRHLECGMQILNRAGFTHIRDMSCSEVQWSEACHLEQSGGLTLAVEQFFSVDENNTFDQALRLALRARREKTINLRPRGIKVFYDGALGSEGAFLSHAYPSGSGRGLILLQDDELREIMKRVWCEGLDLAVHAIGDEAAHHVMVCATQVWQGGVTGRLHLEHCEIMRPETIQLMRQQPVTCHLQPCHWLSDKKWLREKVGELFSAVFPWRALQEAGVPFFFGSDTPIERPSIYNNLLALQDSHYEGVRKLDGDPLQFHCHPDAEWAPNTFSVFSDGRTQRVVFRGRNILN